jgi:hypothetical protein
MPQAQSLTLDELERLVAAELERRSRSTRDEAVRRRRAGSGAA